ncbi:hypothetical protein V6N13_045732 [Hibiscus sabdariffa]|uniref:Uncharacterized protein n=2 Tax=Hibiscus sabdariffa TaxID=183260 RepID=A0ABR2BDV4_9ROSI
MKKAWILFFSSVNRRRCRLAVHLLSRDYSPSAFSSSSSPLHATCRPGPRLIQLPAGTHWFQTSPFRNLSTGAENSSQPSSKRREKSDLVEAFDSAKTTEEMISVFEEMEATEGWFDKKELGIAALKIGRKLEREGAYPKKFSPFAVKALNSLREYGEVSLPFVMALQLLSYYLLGVEKQPFDRDILHLRSAANVLEFIRKQGVNAEDFRVMQHSLQEECLSETDVLRFDNWDEVVKNWGVGSKPIRSEIGATEKHIESGNYDHAVYDLVRVLELTEECSLDRALAFVSMAKALFHRGNVDDSNKWFEIARRILDKKATAFPVEVHTAYHEMIKLYESADESVVAPRPWLDRGLALISILLIRKELTLIYQEHMNINHINGKTVLISVGLMYYLEICCLE